MKHTAKLALCGILAAISLVTLLATGLVPVATYALPGLAGVFLLPAVIQCGKRWAMATYGAVALLALFLVPDREAALVYVAFLGYYPVLKSIIEQHLSRLWEWIAKFSAFNAAIIFAYFLAIQLFGLPLEGFEIAGINLPLAFLAAGNLVFWFYDRALTLLVIQYIRRVHPLLQKYFSK